MTKQEDIIESQETYARVARAIRYLEANYQEQPSLDQLAKEIGLSPFHFQKMFKAWAGVSPKKYLQYLSLTHAKQALRKASPSLFDTTLDTGLSSPSRLHELFVKIEGMSPGAFKKQGVNLRIQYQFASSPFGPMLMAATEIGLCHLHFIERKEAALMRLKADFPKARIEEGLSEWHKPIMAAFDPRVKHIDEIKLHIQGSPFQIKVWEALLRIPSGQLKNYASIATDIDQQGASRAVGTAIGRNPIAYLIPCHRVIQASGHIGGYRWEPTRKKAMIAWEASQFQR